MKKIIFSINSTANRKYFPVLMKIRIPNLIYDDCGRGGVEGVHNLIVDSHFCFPGACNTFLGRLLSKFCHARPQTPKKLLKF